MVSLLKLLFLTTFFYPFVSSKFYHFYGELISPCDGELKVSFAKHYHIFPFKAWVPLMFDRWLLYTKSLKVDVQCLPYDQAMFNTRMSVNEKLVASNQNWKCNEETADIFDGYSFDFEMFDLLKSFWIGKKSTPQISCVLYPEMYEEDLYIGETWTPTVSVEQTKQPTILSDFTRNPTIPITKTPAYQNDDISPVMTPSPTSMTPSPTPSFTWSPTPLPTPSPTLLTPSPTLLTPSPTLLTPSPTLLPSPSILTPSPTLLPSPALLTPSPTLMTPLPSPSIMTPSPTLLTPLPSPSIMTPSPTNEDATTIVIDMVTDSSILEIDPFVLMDVMNEISNNTMNLYDYRLKSWQTLLQSFGNENWTGCDNKVQIEMNSDVSVSTQLLKRVLEDSKLPEQTNVKVCDIIHIDITSEDTCHLLTEACQSSLDCCDTAVCVQNVCTVPFDSSCPLSCDSSFRLVDPEETGYFQSAENTVVDISCTEPDAVIRIYHYSLMKLAMGGVNVKTDPFKIYRIEMEKPSNCHEIQIQIACT